MVVGVDVSSHRIDLAWLENGRPQRWHQDLAKGHLIDRLRSIRVEWPGPLFGERGWNPGHDVSEIAIEMPFSNNRQTNAALSAVAGIVTRQAPPWARVAWPSAGELRAAIGARKNTKIDAYSALHDLDKAWRGIYQDMHHPLTFQDWNEHERDALVACLGWTHILSAQDAA